MELRYEKLAADLEEAISAGEYKPGARLPSIRELAESQGCSNNTAIRAYEELERRHLVFSVEKSGFFVVDKPSPDTDTSLEYGFAPSGMIDMSSASPDERAMPYEDFRHCLNRAVDLYKDKLFDYGHPQGLPSLRELLVKRLYGQQIFADPEQLFIVSGTQQAIHLLAGMPFPNGKTRLLLEQPTYTGMIRSVLLQGVTAIGIPRNAEGVDLLELEKQFRHNDIKFFYTIPRFHNPSGAGYSMDMKKRIVQLADEYDVYIVEDDYLGDLDEDSRNDSMAALGPSGRVLYLKSFSKTVLPGMRLGFAVVPPALAPMLRQHKNAADSSTSALTQGALEIYLKSGMFDRHLKTVRKLYRDRMAVLRESCGRLLPDSIRYEAYDNGIFGIVELPEYADAAAVAARLGQRGLSVASGERMRLPGQPGPGLLRLSIIRADEEEIKRGISILASEIRHILKQGPGCRDYSDADIG